MFLVLFFGVQALALAYLNISLSRRFKWKAREKIIFASLSIAYFIANYAAFKLRHTGDLDFRTIPSQFFFYTTYILLTVFAFAIFYSIFLDVLDVLQKRVQKSEPVNPERRDFFKKTALASAVFGSSAVGIGQAKIGPQYEFVEIPTHLPQMEGLKIVQISDLHVGPIIDREYVEQTVEMVNAQNADLVVLTGDLVDGTPEQLMKDMEPLKNLKSKLGVYGCLGNHELYSGLYDWLPQFEALRIRMLNNEHTVIDTQERTFVLAGMTDPQVGRAYPEFKPDAEQAIRGAPKDLYKIVLAHQPSAFDQAIKAGFDLQISGHTHAGQFFPFSLLVRFVHKYVKGLNLHKENDRSMWVYVNQATGYWGPPNRFAIPAEITVFNFKHNKELS